jgi:hypothetical protein
MGHDCNAQPPGPQAKLAFDLLRTSSEVSVLRTGPAVLLIGLLAAAGAGCRHAVLVADNAPKPEQARATISGTLVRPETKAPVPGREVVVTENTTHARFTATTNATGGFTLLVDPGTYHLDVTLQPGEGLVNPPMALTVGRADIKSGIEIVLGASR